MRATHETVTWRSPLALALALGALALAGAGCRAPQPRGPLSESAVRLDLPLVRQDALHDCGLASISALCQYWGVEIPDEERADLARTAEEEAGLTGNELCDALEGLGLETFLFHGSLDRAPTGLYRHVDAGRPPLVMLTSDGADNHYALVLGYDEPRGEVLLLDPLRGDVSVAVHAFQRSWEGCQRFTLLACPREEEPLASLPEGASDAAARASGSTAHARN